MVLDPDEKWLCVDPGESTGWSLWRGSTLVDAGTEDLWKLGHSVFNAFFREPMENELAEDKLALKFVGITRIVCEDWRIYPWEAKKGTLNWDQCRTARLIGFLTGIAAQAGLEFVLQPAKIKERAQAAGAKHLFLRPLYENRHANDSIMHGTFWLAVKEGVQGVSEIDYETLYGEEMNELL